MDTAGRQDAERERAVREACGSRGTPRASAQACALCGVDIDSSHMAGSSTGMQGDHQHWAGTQSSSLGPVLRIYDEPSCLPLKHT